MITGMEVLELWRYPVKSLRGESLETAILEADGIQGDRRWGIRDDQTGRILTARRRPELLGSSSTYDGDVPVITLPDGTVLSGPGQQTDRALSDWLDSPVALIPSASGDPGRAEFFADATDDTSEAIEWTMPQGRYVDAAAVLVLTTASLAMGQSLHPNGEWDRRRFRPNILVANEGLGWAEDAWVDRTVHVGDGAVRPSQPCVRCTMVTRPQPGLVADVEIFRTLARNHRATFGVWSDVAALGRVATGDPVSVLD